MRSPRTSQGGAEHKLRTEHREQQHPERVARRKQGYPMKRIRSQVQAQHHCSHRSQRPAPVPGFVPTTTALRRVNSAYQTGPPRTSTIHMPFADHAALDSCGHIGHAQLYLKHASATQGKATNTVVHDLAGGRVCLAYDAGSGAAPVRPRDPSC